MLFSDIHRHGDTHSQLTPPDEHRHLASGSGVVAAETVVVAVMATVAAMEATVAVAMMAAATAAMTGDLIVNCYLLRSTCHLLLTG